MKNTIYAMLFFLFGVLLASCGGNDNNTDDANAAPPQSMIEEEAPAPDPMTSKGIGPISSVTLGETIDDAMAAKGKEVFDANCTACHKTDKKFVGPNPTGVTERRTPEWIMNMIMNPENMILEDPTAIALLAEYNGAPMANQNIAEADARAILEYFRTLK
jgi:cytochrome c